MSNISDDNERSCSVCLDNTSNLITCCCGGCDNPVCNSCVESQIPRGEAGWFTITLKCDICGRVACDSCMFTCYECASRGEENLEYCRNCVPDDLQEIECEYHEWWMCGKHEDKRCTQCQVNQNFSDSHVI